MPIKANLWMVGLHHDGWGRHCRDLEHLICFEPLAVRVSEVTDFAALGERWRDLEQRSDGSFFQSWTWIGCLAAERFSDAVLVEAAEAGRTVALGLFNRVRRWVGPSTLFLGENGTAN